MQIKLLEAKLITNTHPTVTVIIKLEGILDHACAVLAFSKGEVKRAGSIRKAVKKRAWYLLHYGLYVYSNWSSTPFA